MPSQVQHVPGPDALRRKAVYYGGTDTIKNGYAFCYDQDYTTDNTGGTRVEKPAAANLKCFAGLAQGLPAAGRKGPCEIQLVVPDVNPQVCMAWTDQSCTATTTKLFVQPGAYELGEIGSGIEVALADEDADRSTTAGQCRVRLYQPVTTPGLIADKLWDTCPLIQIQQDPTIGTIFFDDFIWANKSNITTNTNASLATYSTWSWVGTVLSVGQVTHDDTANGVVKLTCGSTADQFCQMQKNGENYVVATGKDIWYEVRFKMTNVAHQLFMGLADTVNPMFSSGLNVCNDYVGFAKEAGNGTTAPNTTGLWLECEDGTVGAQDFATTAIGTPVTATWHRAGFRITDSATSGTQVIQCWFDGTEAVTTGIATTNLPVTAANLTTPSFHVGSEGTTTPSLEIDWVKIAQLR